MAARQRGRCTEYIRVGLYADSIFDYAPHTLDIAMEFLNWEFADVPTADAPPEWNRADDEGNFRTSPRAEEVISDSDYSEV